VNEEEIKNHLFLKGLNHYKLQEFYEAHEAWEDLWSDYYLEDKKFIQGLIQLSVSFVHLKNNNLNGAKSLLRKCREKFENFNGIHRGIDIHILIKEIQRVDENYSKITDSNTFNWDCVPRIL
tara:strand:+ start:306 stop:671 length:366 start_codon:yes stop_codon:yes gene_type:complete